MQNESSSRGLMQAQEGGGHASGTHDRGLLLIGLFKLGKAIFFFCIGAGAVHLLHKDVGDEVTRLALRLKDSAISDR